MLEDKTLVIAHLQSALKALSETITVTIRIIVNKVKVIFKNKFYLARKIQQIVSYTYLAKLTYQVDV